MPNWCMNSLTVYGEPEKIRKLVKAFEAGAMLSYIAPRPVGLDGGGACDWSRAAWGTKWDVGVSKYGGEKVTYDPQTNPGEAKFWFDSAWTPPIEAYREMEAQGFEVDAKYCETGMCFYGYYADGSDLSMDFAVNCIDDLDGLDSDLAEEFSLYDMFAEQLDE